MTRASTRAREHARRSGCSYVGTSGWSYDHWQGRFYPADLAKKSRFAFFAGQFKTVELNATFYRLFQESTFRKWADQAPDGFLYAVKLWRWITHRRRLVDTGDDLTTFLARAALLRDRLGPVLVQLPPGLHRDDALLSAFLADFAGAQEHLGKPIRVAFEFRHRSWFAEEVFDLLREAHAAFCIADMPKLAFPCRVTADFVYLRFHGAPDIYRSAYDEQTLARWAETLSAELRNGRDVFAYFNNDIDAHAVHNARQLRTLLRAKTGS